MTDFDFNRLPNESKFRHLVRLSVGKLNKEHSMDWLELVDTFNLDYSAETLRKKAYGWKDFIENEEIEQLNSEEEVNYKSTIEIEKGGLQKSDKLIKMSEQDSKNEKFLLKAHGYDDKEWEIVSAKSSIWNQHNKQDGTITLYSSKITVKPKKIGFDIDKFLEKAKQTIKPIHIKNKITDGKKLLEIPLFDLHFGVNTYEDYIDVRDDILTKIKSRRWDKIFFILGQDLLHNNGFDGKTSSGTPIEQVDMTKAWNDAFRFYCEIIDAAQNNANIVEGSYSIANHDDSMAWAFVRCLEVKFPDITFDTSQKMRKAFVWNDVFVGYTHGHKGANRVHENFLSDFGKLMAVAKVVEVHTGHIHQEVGRDKFGVLVRSLSTKGKTDQWHDTEGFVGAHKRFQLFEYSPDSLDAIYYI